MLCHNNRVAILLMSDLCRMMMLMLMSARDEEAVVYVGLTLDGYSVKFLLF